MSKHQMLHSLALLLAGLFLATCQRVSIEEAPDCGSFVKRAAGYTGFPPEERFPYYRSARFTSDSLRDEERIVFLKETRNRTQIIRHRLSDDRTEILYKHDERIDQFDYSAEGDIAFTSEGKVFVIPASQAEPIPLESIGPVWNVKWRGQRLLCQTAPNVLVEVDQSGQVIFEQAWPEAWVVRDYWADDHMLLVANQDSALVYNLPDLTLLWKLALGECCEEVGGAYFYSSNQVSVAALTISDGELNAIFLSTPEILVRIDNR